MTISPEQEGRLRQHYLASIPDVERENVHEAYEKGQRKAESMKDSVPEKLKALLDDLLIMIAISLPASTGMCPGKPLPRSPRPFSTSPRPST